ncbi:hypothetical protein [Scytonema hofmannii]|uniref:hypothetical protein n=1 Tax=Scytonema hofmannii TaxID=34078 RepID=UPI00034AC77F|nr:hypothetical protein [Scytonema hofmannii]
MKSLLQVRSSLGSTEAGFFVSVAQQLPKKAIALHPPELPQKHIVFFILQITPQFLPVRYRWVS